MNVPLQAMTIIGDRRIKEAADKIAKEKELQKVSIKKSDVELIVSCWIPTYYINNSLFCIILQYHLKHVICKMVSVESFK